MEGAPARCESVPGPGAVEPASGRRLDRVRLATRAPASDQVGHPERVGSWRVAYTFEYTEEAVEHIRRLPADRRAKVMDQLEERLAHQPDTRARNRKPMDADRKLYVAPWELRHGDLRVYYAVENALEKVIVVAVGIKQREKLFIGGKEFA